jgi:glycosyltransferase involved in cell wall biosynthesis
MAEHHQTQPHHTPSPVATVVICTYNRSALLASALASLAEVARSPGCPWQVLVVDNNSTDDTRALVERMAPTFPVPLHYEFEPQQGKSRALNRAIAWATTPIVIFGDDDQTFDRRWVEEACRPLLEDPAVSYTGGPVLPTWTAKAPAWLDTRFAELKAPLGLFDYGPESFHFEARRVVPGGGNMAVRRELFSQIGGFRTELGRCGRSLLGQEQAEFFHRSRSAGVRGVYVPGMRVFHRIPAERLTRAYYRRWWYWKGVAQSRFHGMHQRTELGLDLTQVPHVASVPRFLYGTAARETARWLRLAARRRPARFVHELRLAYVLGYIHDRQRHGVRVPPAPSATPVLMPGKVT